ncbi:MAG: membrane dipeptidase [Clostridia bacterium]|nr:membrane dipeptidase [Clostridia bacterium]
MNLFDLHCDTALTLWQRNLPIGSADCHISLDRAARFARYAQVMAIWSDKRIDDTTAYHQFHRVADNLLREQDSERHRAALCRTAAEVRGALEAGKAALILAVEDARLLGGEIDRLAVLAARGVRFLTLTWGGVSCIGGAHDTDEGLTDFGRAVVEKCFALGIIPDISHGSDAVMNEVIALARAAGRPIIATHSNARAVRDHRRNLTDAQFCAVRDLGGIVGISLCPAHLAAKDEPRDVSAVVRHIEHYLALGGEDTVCLGCDLDGTDLPDGFGGIEDVGKIADAMAARGHGDEIIEKVFFGNAVRFVGGNLSFAK